MTFRALPAALIAAILALAGCGSSKLDSFPGFPADKARLGTSTIISDFIILKATPDSLSLVDLGATKIAADTMLHFIQTRLDAKGYNVSTRLLTSVGLSMDSNFTANVTNTSGFDREGEDSPISIHPPFYLYQALRRDPAMRTLLGSLYRRLARMEETDGAYPAMEEIVPLGKALGGGLIFVFLGGGFEVSASVRELGVTPPWVDQVAKIGYEAVSQGSLHLYVLDPDDGRVLWADRQVSTGGMMYNDKFIRMAEIVLEDLP
jgi:hypothetical protein